MDLKQKIGAGLATSFVALSLANTSIAAENRVNGPAVGAPSVPMNIQKDGRKVKIEIPTATPAPSVKSAEKALDAKKPQVVNTQTTTVNSSPSKVSVTLGDSEKATLSTKKKGIKPLSSQSKSLPKKCNSIVYDTLELVNPKILSTKSYEIAEVVPNVCAQVKTENYKDRMELALAEGFGSNYLESKYKVLLPNKQDPIEIEGKNLVALLLPYKTGKKERISVTKVELEVKTHPEPAVVVRDSKIDLVDKTKTQSGLEKLLVGVIGTNPGYVGVGRFKKEADNSYTLLAIDNDTANKISGLSEKDVSELLLKGLDAQTENRTAQTYLVEVIKIQNPNVIETGNDFLNMTHQKYAAEFAGKDVKRYLEKLSVMAVAHGEAQRYVNENVAYLNQIKPEEWVNFWKAPATAIIPLPGVESYGFYKTAGTGNSLVSSDYVAITNSCMDRYNSSVINAGNCISQGINAELNKYSGSYVNRGGVNSSQNQVTGLNDAPKTDKAVSKPITETVGDVFSNLGNTLGNFFRSEPKTGTVAQEDKK